MTKLRQQGFMVCIKLKTECLTCRIRRCRPTRGICRKWAWLHRSGLFSFGSLNMQTHIFELGGLSASFSTARLQSVLAWG